MYWLVRECMEVADSMEMEHTELVQRGNFIATGLVALLIRIALLYFAIRVVRGFGKGLKEVLARADKLDAGKNRLTLAALKKNGAQQGDASEDFGDDVEVEYVLDEDEELDVATVFANTYVGGTTGGNGTEVPYLKQQNN